MRLPLVSAQRLVKALQRNGFVYAPRRGKGSHIALYRVDENGRKFLVIVPMRNPIPRGTLVSIMKQSGLSRDEFLGLLE